MLAVFTVSNLNDAGAGSLREAIGSANGNGGADEIVFQEGLSGTIGLMSQLPTIVADLTITGPGANLLTLDAGGGANGVVGDGDGFRHFNLDDGTTALVDVTISGLTLTGGDVVGEGGAIRNLERLTLTSSTLSANAATNGGGLYNDAITVVASSTFAANSAGADGGAVYNADQTTITNSTLSANAASGRGGGVFDTGSSATVISSTLIGNSAGSGGGVYGFFFTTVTSSIVANSVSGNDVAGEGAFGGSDLTFGGSNLIGDGSGGLADTISGDPLVGPLGDNGGPTPTHALLPGSLAINRGDSSNGLVEDQRGENRIQQGAIDIGAYESPLLPPVLPAGTIVVTSVEGGADGDLSANDVSLAEAITASEIDGVASTILFDPLVFGTPKTINLTQQLPAITEELTITGPGADLLTLDAGGGANGVVGDGDGFRHFVIDDSVAATKVEVSLSGLSLTGGDSPTDGGAILNRERLTLIDSTLSKNASVGGGGAIFNNGAIVVVVGSTVASNASGGFGGGGLYNDPGATATIDGSTFSSNSTGAGGAGGGVLNLGTLAVANSTLTRNSSSFGGGISSISLIGGPPATISNSIVANNTSSDTELVGAFVGGFNLVEDGSGGVATLSGDALLGPLADNGGPTPTHALLPGSPAINAGDGSISGGFDQRGAGYSRVASGQVDIGAYEAQSTPTRAPGDYNGDGRIDAADYTTWRDGLGATGLTPLSGADGDGDGEVTTTDYHVWRSHFGFQFTPPPQNLVANAPSASPPEPATVTFVASVPSATPASPDPPAIDEALLWFAPKSLDAGSPRPLSASATAPATLEEDTLLLLALADVGARPEHNAEPADTMREEGGEESEIDAIERVELLADAF